MSLLRFLKKPTRTHQKSSLTWQGQTVPVTRKAMKSIRLRLDFQGQLILSCPYQIDDQQLTAFLDARCDWIDRHQKKLAQNRASDTDHGSVTHMHLWGQCYQFAPASSASNSWHVDHQQRTVYVPQLPDNEADVEALQQQIWRRELKTFIQQQLPFWQQKMAVKVTFWNIRRMKTKWGSCNVTRARVWLNTNLAKYPQPCAEMVLVHELVHLLEASHNARFYQLMDTFLPEWRNADNLMKQASAH